MRRSDRSPPAERLQSPGRRRRHLAAYRRVQKDDRFAQAGLYLRIVDGLERHANLYSRSVSECGILGGAGQLDYILSVNALADYLAGVDAFAREHKGWKAQRTLLDSEIYPKLGVPPDYVFDKSP